MSDFIVSRDRAILWARQILKTDFVVLDTETTGLDENAEACSIAVIGQDETVLLDSLVKPRSVIPGAASRIHGITNEMVQDAPGILDLESQLAAALNEKTVIIYNADFDASILRQSFLRAGAQLHGAPYRLPERHIVHRLNFMPECAMEAFAAFYGDWNDYRGSYTWKKLTVAASYFNISTDGAHGALADCLMTLGVVRGMAEAKLSNESI